MNIFKFSTEQQMLQFDQKVGSYSGSLTMGESTAWVYNEGLPTWFMLQFCGDRWYLQKCGIGSGRTLTICPETEQELLDACIDFSLGKWPQVNYD